MCAGHTRLPNLTRRCVYHVVSVLHGSYAADQPEILVGQVTAYCAEILSVCGCLSHEGLVQSPDLQGLADGRIQVKQFCVLVEESLLSVSNGHPNVEAIQDVCFTFFSAEMKRTTGNNCEIESLSPTCVYRLWLVFNVLIGGESSVVVGKDNIRDFTKRLFELSGLNGTADPEELSTIKAYWTFPEYIQIITGHFAKQGHPGTLTCEIIEDLYDEFVCGVQMKGYLVKKGHVRKNYKRRWFILRRTALTYYESRETLYKKVSYKYVIKRVI